MGLPLSPARLCCMISPRDVVTALKSLQEQTISYTLIRVIFGGEKGGFCSSILNLVPARVSVWLT